VGRVRAAGSASWHYRAETELLKMVLRVIEEREGEFISRVRADLAEALKLAQQTGKVTPGTTSAPPRDRRRTHTGGMRRRSAAFPDRPPGPEFRIERAARWAGVREDKR
jgi:hypothetical protein